MLYKLIASEIRKNSRDCIYFYDHTTRYMTCFAFDSISLSDGNNLNIRRRIGPIKGSILNKITESVNEKK